MAKANPDKYKTFANLMTVLIEENNKKVRDRIAAFKKKKEDVASHQIPNDSKNCENGVPNYWNAISIYLCEWLISLKPNQLPEESSILSSQDNQVFLLRIYE